MIIHACSELSNPVASLSEASESVLQKNSDEVLFLGNITDPVQVNNYLITFNGKAYDEDKDQSTFSYTVSGTNVNPAFNNISFESPECAGDPVGFIPTNGSYSSGVITWQSSLPINQTRNYSVTYSGDLPVGLVDATINSGSSTDTQEIPGPCKGIYTISGFVYVDANSNEQKEGTEFGIGNVTVHLSNSQNDDYSQKTTYNGAYEFTVFAGSSSSDFTVEVRDETNDDTDFNEQLFNSYSPTTQPPAANVTVSGADESGVNFGFAPQTAKMIQQFEDGSIQLNTEEPKFWIQQLRWARNNNRNAVVSRDELLAYLTEIEGLLLEEPFQFEGDKIADALDILTKPTKSELEILLVQLLTAELNIVSGRGSESLDFDLALAAFGESAAAELMAAAGGNLFMSKSISIEEVSTTLTTSNSTSGDAVSLLTSFNFSGGGGGGIGTK